MGAMLFFFSFIKSVKCFCPIASIKYYMAGFDTRVNVLKQVLPQCWEEMIGHKRITIQVYMCNYMNKCILGTPIHVLWLYIYYIERFK